MPQHPKFWSITLLRQALKNRFTGFLTKANFVKLLKVEGIYPTSEPKMYLSLGVTSFKCLLIVLLADFATLNQSKLYS